MSCSELTRIPRQPAELDMGVQAADLQVGWLIDGTLACRLLMMATVFHQRTRHHLSIISGYRTPEHQVCLGQQGRPAAPVHLSTHTICPATGADLRMSGFATQALKAEFGRAAISAGLRWGGGSTVDPSTGIPSDWNHVDLGPRSQG